jgi:hypothetical protein
MSPGGGDDALSLSCGLRFSTWQAKAAQQAGVSRVGAKGIELRVKN